MKTCGTCKHWFFPEVPKDSPVAPEDIKGECRLNPPVITVSGATYFPLVSPGCFCSKHEAKGEK
jgi:hypothetical protein